MVCAIEDYIVLLALVAHDVGWVSFEPKLGVPAMLLALGFQTGIMFSRCRRRNFSLINEVSIFFWLLGGEIWTFSEYMWDNGYPAGILGEIELLQKLDIRWYAFGMSAAVCLMASTCVALLVAHMLRCLCASRGARAGLDRAAPLVENEHEAAHEPHTVCWYFPSHVYEELFLLPWIMSDTTWAACNLLDICNYEVPGVLIAFGVLTCLTSIAIQVDCVRRHRAAGETSDATLCVAEALWVTGNLLWMIEDVSWDGDCSVAHTGALGLFLVSFTLTAALALVSHWPVSSSSRFRDQCPMLSSRLLGADALASSRSLEADGMSARLDFGLSNGHPPSALLQCEALNVTTVQDPIKDVKKPRSRQRRSSRSSRLMRDVEVLARRRPNECDNVKVAASLALRALGNPEKPIVILNIGQVSRRLEEWRSFLPRVLPRYAVRHQTDKKVLHILHQGRCTFECGTMSEVGLMLAFGVSSEELFFSQPCETRSDLGFIRNKGVQLMPFDNAVELRKVAVEHPGAKLLLQISGEDSERSAAQRQPRNMLARLGAVCSDWEPLLALAAELRLQIVGVSFAAGCCCQDPSQFENILLKARQAFQLGTERGFPMSILDLGDSFFGGLSSKNTACNMFVDRASQLNKQLASIFPTEVFPQLQISAEVGSFLVGDAISLLTKVVSKTVDEPQLEQHQNKDPLSPHADDMSTQPSIRYVLNDNLGFPYARARILEGSSEVKPEVLGFDAGHVRQCCIMGRFAGGSPTLIAEVTIPEVDEGEWLLWRSMGNHLLGPGSKRQTGNLTSGRVTEQSSPAEVCVWYYAEEEAARCL